MANRIKPLIKKLQDLLEEAEAHWAEAMEDDSDFRDPLADLCSNLHEAITDLEALV